MKGRLINKILLFSILIFITACVNDTSNSKELSSTTKSSVKEKQKTTSSPINSASNTGFIKDKKWEFPWLKAYSIDNCLANRIATPQGFKRSQSREAMDDWLRSLPLKEGKPDVRLHNGQLKGYQKAHFAVVDIDTGTKDLQQCADAVMRLRAEYLFEQQFEQAITFNFTSGDACAWSKWKQGWRPEIHGNRVVWNQRKRPDSSYKNFKDYLQMVYTYAGTLSLEKELEKQKVNQIKAGDVFIQGGSPGHAVMVMDVAENEKGEKVFLLAQSYMPAQDMHILKNPNDSQLSPWYKLEEGQSLRTPEWTFDSEDLRQFSF